MNLITSATGDGIEAYIAVNLNDFGLKLNIWILQKTNKKCLERKYYVLAMERYLQSWDVDRIH